MSTRQLILDTETTGLSAKNGDRLIEIAALEMIDRRITGEHLHLYINPEREIHSDAIAVHGITNEFLQDKPIFAEVGLQIFNYLRDAELIIHNAPFDVGFLNMEFTQMGLPQIETIATITDTLVMAREIYPNQKNSLDALCNRLNVDRSKRVLHGALIDCELLGEVYLAMTREQGTLDMNIQTDDEQDKSSGSVITYSRPEKLKIIYATADELAIHQEYLNELDKACGGLCQFHAMDSNFQKETTATQETVVTIIEEEKEDDYIEDEYIEFNDLQEPPMESWQ
ncbi:MAG: DNA polymerase III subunit epsilon [Neisseriaceae bacterium]|nr:DNA polymerase III subunit epsilon [Neisseriaceae bacterium]